MEEVNVRKINTHGMWMLGGFFFAMCTYNAFMVSTLVDFGWNAANVTLIMTGMSLLNLVLAPIYGYLSDRYFSEKKLVLTLLMLGGLNFLGLPFTLGSNNYALVLLNMFGVALTAAQVPALMDAWIVGLKQEINGINYGVIRGSGSFSFAISAQVAGIVTAQFGHGMRFSMGAVAFFVTFLIALKFRETRKNIGQVKEEQEEEKITGKAAIRLIFKSKRYRLLMVSAFFLMVSISPLLTLLQILIPELGGSTTQIGTAVFFMAGSEVPFMFLTGIILKKFGYKKTLLSISALFVGRMFFMVSMTSVNGLIYSQLFQGLTFAVLLPTTMSYLSHIVDSRVRSTAIAVFSAVVTSFSGITANLTTATLLSRDIEAHNILLVFAFCALVGFGFVVYGTVRKIWR